MNTDKKPRLKTSVFWTIQTEKLIEIFNQSSSLTEVMSTIDANASCNGGSYKTLMERIKKEKSIDYQRYKKEWSSQRKIISKDRFPMEVFLKENSTANRTHLKRRILEENLLENKCSVCGQLPEWFGKPLTLQLDHINGINNDNRLENLRIICPNCHTQTNNYGGRKLRKPRPSDEPNYRNKPKPQSRKVERPSKEDLIVLIENNSMVTLGKMFGVSDNAVRKWANSYGIRTKKVRDYK